MSGNFYRSIKPYTSDLRFWILAFFIIRLYGIWFPPLEVSHNWRQTTVTMVARNFYETDNNILYPRIDIAGEKTGITGMEFPILNYLIYLVSLLFGYEPWYGRLINLCISSMGIWYFFKLLRRYFNAQMAFNAGIVLLFSIWFTYSRKIMPDTFSMSFILYGLYKVSKYFDTGKIKQLLLYVAALLIGGLAKLPSCYILVLLVFFIFSNKFALKKKVWLTVSTTLVMMICLVYYFYWVPYLTKTFGFWHFFMGKSFSEGASELYAHLDQTLAKFYDVAIKFIAFAFFLLGLYYGFRQKNRLLLSITGLAFAGFLPVMLKSGFTFYHHSYYIIPLVPVMAMVSGFGIQQLPKKIYIKIILIAIGIEGCGNHLDDFRIKPENAALINLEADLDKVSSRKDLIIFNSGAFPTPMYFAHRKGWVAFSEQVSDTRFIDSLEKKGLRYIVIMKRSFGEDITLPYLKLSENESYRIYKVPVNRE